MSLTPIDPTENVKDLVKLQSKHQDEIMAWQDRYQTAMREAETRRLNDIERISNYYGNIIETMRQEAIKLLAEQVKENKLDAGTRFAVLERVLSGNEGKAAVYAALAVIAALAISVAAIVWTRTP